MIKSLYKKNMNKKGNKKEKNKKSCNLQATLKIKDFTMYKPYFLKKLQNFLMQKNY